MMYFNVYYYFNTKNAMLKTEDQANVLSFEPKKGRGACFVFLY